MATHLSVRLAAPAALGGALRVGDADGDDEVAQEEAAGLGVLRTLYCRKHHSRKRDDGAADPFPKDRTLFVANVSGHCTERDIAHIFERFGPIEAVQLSRFPSALAAQFDGVRAADVTATHAAHVVFAKPKSLLKCLNAQDPEALADVPCEMLQVEERRVGLRAWQQAHQAARPDPEALQREVNEAMQAYDALQAQRAAEERAKFNQPDEDGWVTVTSAARKRRVKDGQVKVMAARKTSLSAGKNQVAKKKKEQILQDFYRFQRRERQRKELTDLRRKFELDKERVAQMKANRKFRPF